MVFFKENYFINNRFNANVDDFRRMESARNLLVGLVKQLEASSKKMMFRYIQQVPLLNFL